MCRSSRPLHNFDPPAKGDGIYAPARAAPKGRNAEGAKARLARRSAVVARE